MTSGYTKLASAILGSSIWDEDDQTRIIWITMLAMRNKNHIVEASIPGLARFARVPIEACEKALEKLSSPDKYSRTPDNEGRRIQKVEGGWLVLNGNKYRDMWSEDERREYHREYWHKRDHSTKLNKTQQTQSSNSNSNSNSNSTEKEEKSTKRSRKPSSDEELLSYASEIGVSRLDALAFRDSQESGGWTRGGKPICDWKATLRTWQRYGYLASQKQSQVKAQVPAPLRNLKTV